MQGKPVVGIELGAQLLALAADGGSEAAPLAFEVGHGTTDRGRCAQRLSARALSARLLSCATGRVPPAYARVLAEDEAGRPALFQIGENAFGFSFHPGFKLAIAEDLIMEFEENPADPAPALERLRRHEAARSRMRWCRS